MGVRNCAEVGENLQKIMTRLMANDNLVNLLYYTDKDPLNQPHLTNQEKREKATWLTVVFMVVILTIGAKFFIA